MRNQAERSSTGQRPDGESRSFQSLTPEAFNKLLPAAKTDYLLEGRTRRDFFDPQQGDYLAEGLKTAAAVGRAGYWHWNDIPGVTPRWIITSDKLDPQMTPEQEGEWDRRDNYGGMWN